ncbi:MAG: twin-arginine translocation signal domain-containing protein, partial [Chloroflexota bacterium]|nr:twin-arginine translocation signal domain-containing protein [Chloroflexota bacterium]
MQPISRRDFLARSGASLALLGLPRLRLFDDVPRENAPPAPLGRIATWWWQAVRAEPSPSADPVSW